MRRIGTPTSVCPSRRFRFGGTLPLSPAGRTGRSTGCAGCRRPTRAGRCCRSRRSSSCGRYSAVGGCRRRAVGLSGRGGCGRGRRRRFVPPPG